MTQFIEGLDRQQTMLLPECLDDYVDENGPVRAIDAFSGRCRTNSNQSLQRQ